MPQKEYKHADVEVVCGDCEFNIPVSKPFDQDIPVIKEDITNTVKRYFGSKYTIARLHACSGGHNVKLRLY